MKTGYRPSLFNGPPVAVLPCSGTAVLAAQAGAGNLVAASTLLAVLVVAGVAAAWSYRHGRWNTLAIAALAGWPLGLLAGLVPHMLIGG